MSKNTNFIIVILMLVAGFTISVIQRDILESRVKELETENKELTEKAKPTLRNYNNPKCSCTCSIK